MLTHFDFLQMSIGLSLSILEAGWAQMDGRPLMVDLVESLDRSSMEERRVRVKIHHIHLVMLLLPRLVSVQEELGRPLRIVAPPTWVSNAIDRYQWDR